jgi:CRISPR-associated protein Cas2
MPMTVVVTCNVSDRMRGFLASTMLELAAGVYSAPRLNPAVRNRVWRVLEEWFLAEKDASVIMVWADPQQPGGQSVKVLGLPPIEVVDIDGLIVSRRSLPGSKDL